MAQDYAASVSGTHIRITRLGPDGAPLVGTDNSYVTKAFVSMSMSPEFEDGDEFTRKTAAGEVCISVKTPDTLKRVTLSISLCNPDPEFTQMLAGGMLLSEAGTPTNTLGWLAPQTGIDPTPNGVAIEVWSKAMLNGKPAPVNPYYHWLVPYAVMRLSGEQVIQNDILETTFEGWGVGNAAFDDGPAAPFWPWQSDRAYGYTRTASLPVGTGYQAVVADTP
jgi:hypothetical protein